MPNKNPPEQTRFSKDKQPTPDQRKKASESRKMRLKLKPFIVKYGNMSIHEFHELQKKIKKNPKDYTMLELVAISAISKMSKDFRYYQDHRDRAEGKAIQKQEIQADVTEDLNVKGQVSVKETLEVCDEDAATTLSILLGAGAIKPRRKKSTKAETDKVDTVDSDT